jgi:hypothetical protein
LGEGWIKVEKRASIVVVAPRLDSALTPRSTRLMYLMVVMCHEGVTVVLLMAAANHSEDGPSAQHRYSRTESRD